MIFSLGRTRSPKYISGTVSPGSISWARFSCNRSSRSILLHFQARAAPPNRLWMNVLRGALVRREQHRLLAAIKGDGRSPMPLRSSSSSRSS